MIKKLKNNFLLTSSIAIGAILIIASGIIVTGTLQQKNLPARASQEKQEEEIIEKDGEIYVIEKDDPIALIIISDNNCEECTKSIQTTKDRLKTQLASPLAIREVEYASKEGTALAQQLEATYLPLFIVGKEVEKKANFMHLTHHVLTKKNELYFADLEKMGAPIGQYLNVTNYAKDDKNAPKITAAKMEYDFGDVYLKNGKVQTEFTVTNEGKSPLEFLNVNTSCGCTSAQVKLPDAESPIYLMAGHGEPVKWSGTLQPGEEGKIIVYYDPTVHPDLNGAVTREVSITTNDPNTPKLTLKIQVNQISQ